MIKNIVLGSYLCLLITNSLTHGKIETIARPSKSRISKVKVSDKELKTLSEELLRKDKNNAAKYITINYQAKTSSTSKEDNAVKPLLEILPDAWDIPTIKKILPLMDNYKRETFLNEVVTTEEKIEEEAFMDAIMSTAVIGHLMNFLKRKGYVKPDSRWQRDFLKRLWFSLYSRDKGKLSSCAFEFTFISEKKKGKILGLHSWIYFFREESSKRINYLGYLDYLQLIDKGVLIKLHFNHLYVDKPENTMFIGTSPEFEIALYTLCFVTRADTNCNLKLGNNDVVIVTNSIRYLGKKLIDSINTEFNCTNPYPTANSTILLSNTIVGSHTVPTSKFTRKQKYVTTNTDNNMSRENATKNQTGDVEISTSDYQTTKSITTTPESRGNLNYKVTTSRPTSENTPENIFNDTQYQFFQKQTTKSITVKTITTEYQDSKPTTLIKESTENQDYTFHTNTTFCPTKANTAENIMYDTQYESLENQTTYFVTVMTLSTEDQNTTLTTETTEHHAYTVPNYTNTTFNPNRVNTAENIIYNTQYQPSENQTTNNFTVITISTENQDSNTPNYNYTTSPTRSISRNTLENISFSNLTAENMTPSSSSTQTCSDLQNRNSIEQQISQNTSTTTKKTSTSSRRPLTHQSTSVLPSSVIAKHEQKKLVSDVEIKILSEQLLRADVNNAAKYVTVNCQRKKTVNSKEDKAPQPLLDVSANAWSIPTIKKFVPLLDNYEMDSLINERVTSQERKEENAFLDAIMSTKVIKVLMNFLKKKGYVSSVLRQQKLFLKQIWFTLYSKDQRKLSSSAFEHIFVSEIVKKKVEGSHNWIYFSRKESFHKINYLGFLKLLPIVDKGVVLELHYAYIGVDVLLKTMFIGISPELEIALYTLCFVVRADTNCNLKLGNKDVSIVTHTFRHNNQKILESAYPKL